MNYMKDNNIIKISGIEWETNGVEVDLPKEVDLPADIDAHDNEAIANYLSDTYGFLVISYSAPMKDDDADEFGMYVNEVEGRVS